MTALAAGTTWFVAAPKIPEGEGPEWGKAAPIGLLVIVLLCISVWLLLRSMSKHMRIVRERFPEERRGFYLDGAGGSPDNPDDADQAYIDLPDTDLSDTDPAGTDPADHSGSDAADRSPGTGAGTHTDAPDAAPVDSAQGPDGQSLTLHKD